MENKKEIKTLAKIDIAFINNRMVAILSLLGFLIATIFMFYLYTEAVIRNTDRVYIARDMSLERVLDKKAMVRGHVTNFYKLFFEIDQYNYKQNINKSLELIGESGKELNRMYANANYYGRLVTSNQSTAVDIDSIKIYNEHPPYQVEVFAKRYIRAAHGFKAMTCDATMLVYQVANSEKNPYGLMIEDLKLKKQIDLKIDPNDLKAKNETSTKP